VNGVENESTYCLMSNHFHLVVETPQANLVEGMKWFLGHGQSGVFGLAAESKQTGWGGPMISAGYDNIY